MTLWNGFIRSKARKPAENFIAEANERISGPSKEYLPEVIVGTELASGNRGQQQPTNKPIENLIPEGQQKMAVEKSTYDLCNLAEAGAGIQLDATRYIVSDLLQIAQKMSQSSSFKLSNCSSISTSDLIKIIDACRGSVILD